MANKTIALRLSELTGITGLKLRLLDAGTLINTGGDTLTESTNGWFTCVITEAIDGGCTTSTWLIPLEAWRRAVAKSTSQVKQPALHCRGS